MKIVNKTIKQIQIVSIIAAVIFLLVSIIFYLTSPILDYMIVIALTIGVGPSSIAQIIHKRWQHKIEKATPEFLRDLATASKTGIPLQTSLEHASNRTYGPLTAELKVLVAQMSWGMNFNEALNKFGERLDLPLIKKATVLINEAGTHGGDMSDIFESTAKYLENINAWHSKRQMQTFPYIAIFYFSVLVFLFIIIVISNMMFTPLAQTIGDTSFIKPVLTQAQSSRMFLHASLLESLFGGLIAGKINEDSFIDGLKHVMLLSIASGVAFYLFL
jgi:archaeal flagellar protein FlaJ